MLLIRSDGTAGQGYDGGLPTQQGSGRGGDGIMVLSNDPPINGSNNSTTFGVSMSLRTKYSRSSVTMRLDGDILMAYQTLSEKNKGVMVALDTLMVLISGKNGGSGIVIVRYIRKNRKCKCHFSQNCIW